MMNLYFDTAATTYVCDESIAAMEHSMRENFGNPSSLHSKGMKSEQSLNEARKFFAASLGVSSKEIYFTSGGTESNNLALQGVAKAYQRNGKHIITTSFEHPSVGSTLASLSDEGYEVTWIPISKLGTIDADELCALIRTDTILVSVMHVNNEIGLVQDIVKIGTQIKEKNANTLFHVDGIQGYMKFPINIKQAKIDLFSASSHKIYGPKGVGLLYIKQNTKIKPMLFGGSQQSSIRPGTENVPGIMGFYAAAKRLDPLKNEYFVKVTEIKKQLIELIVEKLPEWSINSGETTQDIMNPRWSPYIVSIRSKSIKGEVLLHALEDYSICVSTGSACSSKKLNISHVLKSIGLKDEESDRTIRVSLNHEHSFEDIQFFVEALVKIDAQFGRFTKK